MHLGNGEKCRVKSAECRVQSAEVRRGLVMMRDESVMYWIWLSEKFGVASKEFPRLADNYRDPYDVYRLDEEEIEQLEGISDKIKRKLCDKSLERAYSIMRYCSKNKIDVIGYWDARYPSRLKTIEDPPVLLYCIGVMPKLDSRLCIGMVGTRKMSEYGKQSALRISYELASAGVCVVSGMALGIDGVCACGALEAGGTTIAVLGCGVSVTYPKEHSRLMKQIAKHGAVISEYPPEEEPKAENFPKRNRIISGLCQGVLVVECAKRSGALITASRAIAQGRELFALPGKIDDVSSAGPNELIQDGANVVLGATDVIDHYGFLYGDVIDYGGLTKSKRRFNLDDKTLKKYGVESRKIKGGRTRSQTDDVTPPSHNEQAQNDCVPAAAGPIAVQSNNNAAIVEALDADTRKIYELLPDGKAFTPDVVGTDVADVGAIMTALTVLEISGLIESRPGGAYLKK